MCIHCLKKLHPFCFCNNLVKCQPISIIFDTVTLEYISYNMRYVLPTAFNVCSYTTLVKMNGLISTCLTTGNVYFISAKLLLFSMPTLHAPARMPTEDKSSTFCLSCLVLFLFLTLFFCHFLNFVLTM